MANSNKFKEAWIETGKLSFSLADFVKTVCVISLASWACGFLIRFTGIENNSALIYVFSVFIVSYITEGYIWGILASVVATFALNYYFMKPYAAFDFFSTGYPVALLSMIAVAVLTGMMTTKIKQQAKEAEQREKKTRELLEMNQRLEAERTAIQVEAEK